MRSGFLLRVAEIGLYIAMAVAVLAFGGAAPPYFLVSQVIVLALGVLLLSAPRRLCPGCVRPPVLAPLLLVALVLLQLLPFPVAHVPASDRTYDAIPDRSYATVSIAPYQTVSHFLLLVTYLSAFYSVLLVCRDRNARKRLIYFFVSLGTVESFYGLLQYLTGWQHIFTYVKKYYVEDATGTYINRNHFAGLLEMILPFAVGLALCQTGFLRGVAVGCRPQARRLASARELPLFIFWCFIATTISTALVFSRSRMGIVSALISLLAILTLAKETLLSARPRVVVAAMLLIGVIGLVIWIGSDPVLTRFQTLVLESRHAGQNRISIWRDTLRLICQHPLLGTGLGTFPIAYPSVQTVFLTFLVDHAHCDYLEIASELGLPGAILLSSSILWVLAGAVRRYSNIRDSLDVSACLGCVGSITAILVHSVSDFNLHIPANALFFTAVLALASSTVHAREVTNGRLFLSECDGSSSLPGPPNSNRSEGRTMRRPSGPRVY